MALAGDLPDVDISDKGVKITPLDNSVPPAASPFGDLVYGMLPHPHLLGFAFAPRIRDLHDKRLFIHGKAELYPGLQSIISSTSLNLKEMARDTASGKFYKAGNGNSITDDEKTGQLPETEWSGKGSEGDWSHRKVIIYAGLVPGSFPTSTRTGRIE